ncbi:hypothetical protein GCM10010211_72000 [Streptomyces albospinus]|uniref:Uncharacterized protein n=1 Tax=Streptomyces albospinus TaxID=285515 RepID=A0ABQ2VKP1_9ACTN|nr:hypothetical protein GCM10010211_72000 [Streptomyces albospinus]
MADAAQLDHVGLGAVRAGVVDHDPVHGAPVAVNVAVVGAPVPNLDHAEAGVFQRGEKLVPSKWCCHVG